MTKSNQPIMTARRVEEYWIKKSRNDPISFFQYVSGHKPAAHHKLWFSKMIDPNHRFLNLIGPRESAKTTVAVYAMLWMMSKNPLLTNVIVSVSASQAKKRLSMMRDIILANARYRNVFPNIEIDKNKPFTATEFTLRNTEHNYPVWRSLVTRHGSLKDPTLLAIGAGGSGIIGARVSGVILLDDIVDDKSLSVAAQSNMMDYINSVLVPLLREETRARLINIGTRWMEGDIYQQMEENDSYTTITIPAIRYDEDNQPHSYWAEVWSLDALEEKRKQINNDIIFRTMYLCDPSSHTSGMFTVPMFGGSELPSPLPQFKYVYISTDQAISLKARADWNVAQIWGIDAKDHFYLLDMLRFKATVQGQRSSIISFADDCVIRYGKLDGILFENVAYQSALPQMILEQRPDLPIRMVKIVGDKATRASLVSGWLEQKKLFINHQSWWYQVLLQEWTNFPIASHDDTLDAASLVFRYYFHQKQTIRVKARYIDIGS